MTPTLGYAIAAMVDGEDHRRLKTWVETAERGVREDAPLIPFAEEAPKIARFSFRIERV